MEVKNALKKRTAAKRQFTITIKGAEDMIEGRGPVTTVNKWMQDARLKWKDVQDKHEEYVMLKDEEEEPEKDDEWIQQEAKRFQEIERKIDSYVEQIEEERIKGEEMRRFEGMAMEQKRKEEEDMHIKIIENQNYLRNIVMQRTNEERKFRRIVTEIENDIKGDNEDELKFVVMLIEDNLKLLEKCKTRCEEIQESYMIYNQDASDDDSKRWMKC